MNSTKNTMNKENSTKKVVHQVDTQHIGRMIFAGLLIVALIAMVVGVAFEGLAPKYLLAVNGEKLKEKDLIYDIYQSESIGSQMASLYAQLGYTTDYWTMDNGDGTTTQDSLKDQTVENYMYNRVLYTAAMQEGYEATEEEKTDAADTAKNEIEALTKDKADKLGLTEDVLTQKALEETIIGRYKEDKIAALNLDEDQIKAGVDAETYHGYKVEYLYVDTTTTNDAGETVAVDDKTAVYDKLSEALTKAKDTTDWSTLADKEGDNQVVKYTSGVQTKDDNSFNDDVMKTITAMNNGDISDIIETEDGYYAFRMIDNNDTEKYDEAVSQAISDAQEEAFNNIYQDLYSDYTVKVYDKNWKSIIFGTVTLG